MGSSSRTTANVEAATTEAATAVIAAAIIEVAEAVATVAAMKVKCVARRILHVCRSEL